MWLGPVNILWLKRTEEPLGFGLPRPAVFPPLTMAFQEKSDPSLSGINVSSQVTYRRSSLFSQAKETYAVLAVRSSAYLYFKFSSLTASCFGPSLHIPW